MSIKKVMNSPRIFRSPKHARAEPPEEQNKAKNVEEIKDQIRRKWSDLQSEVTAFMKSDSDDQSSAQIEEKLFELRHEILELSQQLDQAKAQNERTDVEEYIQTLTESLKCNPQNYSQFLIGKFRR